MEHAARLPGNWSSTHAHNYIHDVHVHVYAGRLLGDYYQVMVIGLINELE